MLYTFAMDDSLEVLSTEVCFPDGVVDSLAAPSERAAAHLKRAKVGQSRVAVAHGSLSLDDVTRGECVSYEVDVKGLLVGAGRSDGAQRVGGDALLSPDLWLWYPEPRNDAMTLRARFRLPAGLQVAIPWPRETADGYSHRIPPSAFVWQSQAAFGTFETGRLDLPGGHFELVWLGDGFGPRRRAVSEWIERGASAAVSWMGPLPVERVQLLVVPDSGRGESFGFAVRGGGPSATLLLPSRPGRAQLDADWTAVHELLHFYLPPMPVTEAWLYEGFVTYFTATARAAAGMVSERYAWWELLDGFERGSRSGTGVTLREECRSMHATHAYWRVYWAGAALALEIDAALHERGKSLAAALSKIELGDDHRWTGEALLAEVDRISETDVAVRTAARFLDTTAFPDSGPLLRRLGVSLRPGKTVAFDDEAPAADLRRALLRPARAPTPRSGSVDGKSPHGPLRGEGP